MGSSSVTGDETILFSDNMSFDGTARGGKMTLNGQLWIGQTASDRANNGGHVKLGSIVSPFGTVQIGYSSPNITLDITGGATAIERIILQTGTTPVVPIAGNITFNGAVVAAGTNPVRTDGTAAGTMALEVQKSQAIASADATKIGLCNFDSASFAVDANGFVTLAGGTEAIDSIGVDATSGGGTNPVLPTAGGLVTVNGAVIAASTTPIRTVSTAANVYQIQIQTSQALAAADATKIGLSNFDSSSFSVAATGFVTLSTTGAGKTITGDSGGALSPTANNWNILGLSGSKTSGSGSTLTVKSPPYADSTAATLTVNSGTFATAAGAYVLPAAPAVGDLVEVVCITTGIVVTANSGQKIQLAIDVTSTAGTFTNSAKGDVLVMRFRATDSIWYCTSSAGVWVSA